MGVWCAPELFEVAGHAMFVWSRLFCWDFGFRSPCFDVLAMKVCQGHDRQFFDSGFPEDVEEGGPLGPDELVLAQDAVGAQGSQCLLA